MNNGTHNRHSPALFPAELQSGLPSSVFSAASIASTRLEIDSPVILFSYRFIIADSRSIKYRFINVLSL
jgi:hypothetical protein